MAEPQAIRKTYVDLPWGQLHCRTVPGPGVGPLMVLLHQSPLSARNYDALLPMLAGRVRPFAIDTPGYGSSSPVPEHWEVEDYARVVWELADAQGADRIVLFGRATGAVFALEAALLQPHRVACLMLHGLPVYTDAERADRMAHFAPAFTRADDGAHLMAIWNRIHGEYPWIGPELATHFTRDFLAAGDDFARSYRAIWRYDIARRVAANLHVPTLLVGGSADRIAFMHARAVALLPQAESVFLQAATDFVAEQDPALLAGHLQAFIARHA